MKSVLDTLLQIPAGMVETGLHTMNAALGAMQSSVETLTGQKSPSPLKAPPLEGPKDIDTAVSDFANRLARIARFTSWEVSELGVAFRETVVAARRSFGYLDLGDPRHIACPIQLALSFGTLMTQQARRDLVRYEV